MNPSLASANDPIPARMGGLLGLPLTSEADVFELVRAGLTADAWTTLCATAPLPRDLFVNADYARLMATLGRRFSTAETDLILRAVRLFAQAQEALGSHRAATAWLATPIDLRQGLPPVAPWTLATTEAGARLCERLLGIGAAVSAPPAESRSPEADAAVRGSEHATMSDAELAWAAALEEQAAAGAAATPSDSPVGADVDIDAVLGEAAADPHELDWAAALAEQAAAGSDGEVASSDDADAILAQAAAQAGS